MSENSLATCNEIEKEVVRVLTVKLGWESALAKKELGRVTSNAIHVQLQGNINVCRDPDDDKVLECAMRSDASLLVTGDKDLLEMQQFGRTKIVSPAEYLRVPATSP